MKRSLIAIAVSLLTLTSCADYLTPDGEITEREIEIPTAAEGIEITDGMRLVLDETIPTGTAIIRTHGNIQSYIKAETNRNRTIFTVDARRFKNLDVTITISPASYNTFTASGGSEIYSPEMQNLAKASFIRRFSCQDIGNMRHGIHRVLGRVGADTHGRKCQCQYHLLGRLALLRL